MTTNNETFEKWFDAELNKLIAHKDYDTMHMLQINKPLAYRAWQAAPTVQQQQISYPKNRTNIDDMCEILKFLNIKVDEYTDSTIVYKATFEQLRTIYNLGKDNTPTVQREGWVSVPIEPTWEMTNNASETTDVNSFIDINNVYKAMLQAAPTCEKES